MSGTLGTLANSGVIANATNAINLAGTLTTLINLAGGTISGSNALYLTGTLGGLSDSGVIRGTIDNESANALTITGAAAGTIGTLTGQSGRGTIVGTLSNLVFASGNLLLNDNIIATGHTVSNTGAALTLNTIVNIAGNYSQTGGTLSVTPGNSSLIVTGTAAITGGTIAASLSATGNYLTGTPSTLVAGGAGSSYSATLDSNSITGLVSSIASSGNNLVLSYGNDYVGGSLAAITNTGALSATTAVYIAATGSLGALHNSGTITGNIVNLSGHALSITGGSGATIGSLTGGTITSTGANVVLASGNLLLGDAVDVGGGIVVNGGASVQLPSALTITGNYAQNAGTLDVGSNVLSVTGAASITGGTVAASLVSTANYLVGTGGATLVAGGAGSNYTGVTVTAGTLTGLATMSSISGNNLVLAIGNDYIGGSLASIGNTGTISGVSYAAYIAATGTVGTFTNSGTLSGSANGFANNGSIGTVSNTGLISSTSNALDNNGTIDFVTIGVAGTIHGAIGAALWNEAGHGIGTLNNAGNLISDSAAGVADYGAIGVLSNTGTINGFAQAVYIDASGSVGALGNSGTITADQNAIQLAGTMGTLTNSGFISSAAAAVDVSGNLGTLLNLAGGTLSGPTALAVSGTLGGLANSGLILGSIVNTGTGDLAISGGTGATIGTLTGASLAVPGAISNTLANVTLSGNLLLNDDIDAGSHTVTNSGANLTLNSIISVTGDYRQSGGTITITPGTSGLDVSGAANVANARIVTTLSGTGNYLAGAIATVISAGAASSYTSDTVVTNNITGLNAGGSASGNDYLLVANNDYVGGTLASLNNTATITGPSTGLYVATTGSIGTLTNSGTLGGGQFGVNNRGTIDTLSNSGRITNNNFTALWNQGSIGQLTNTGTITNSSWAIHNTGTIGTLTNSGVVSGAGNAIQNDGVVTLLSNSGTMSGGSNVIAGNFATIANSGLIQGNINKDGGANVGTIIGGSAGTVGTFTGFSGGTQGTIGATGNLVFASGDLLLNDSITAAGISESALTISNAGANITLSTIVNVTGNFRQTGGGIDLGSSGELVVSQAASIIGGSVVASGLSSTGIYLAGTQISTLIAGGAGSNYTGVNVSIAGAVVGPAANGLVSGNNLVLGVSNDYIGGSIASVANTGTISGVSYAVFVASTGTIGTFTNTGTLSGSNSGFSNNGSVGTVSNSGLITSSVKGFGNQSTIGLVDNAVGGTILGGTAAGFQNDTQLGTLTNAGLISSGSAGVADYGTMGQLINTGSINGGPQGIYVDGSGSIGSLNNSGTITAAQSAIQVSGTLGTLVNSGVIANATNAINVAGTLATLINLAGGTISGSNALYLTGTLGGLSDSGVIRGTIDNESANALTIT
ncbi:MAG: S-layer family protein, partial [Mycobacterium sp.]|nr:S-layer family protein [Mycobacterium sp.]